MCETKHYAWGEKEEGEKEKEKQSGVEIEKTLANKPPVRSIARQIAAISLLSVVALAFIVTYFVYTEELKETIETVTEVCSDSHPSTDKFKKTPPQMVTVWSFNISNPIGFLNGDTAEIHEMGPYGVKLDTIKKGVDFSESAGTVSYNMYYEFSEKLSNSCDGCRLSDRVNIQNYGYSSSFASAQHEGLLLLGMTCTTTQIGLISSSASVPLCSSSERGSPSATCRCCYAVNASDPENVCNNVVSKTSKAGGMVSWLSKYDNGVKLSNESSDFTLSTGAYSSLVRNVAVSEMLWGHPSSLLGLLAVSAAVSSGSSPSTDYIIDLSSNLTQDMRDACYVSYCPSISEVSQAYMSSGVSALRDVECVGTVPSRDDLVAMGLSEQRADDLRYLEGVDCKPFSVAIVIGTILTLDSGSSKTCADGSTDMPCCLTSFQSSAFSLSGAGLGCMQWVSGLSQPRRVYSNSEAEQFITPSPETVVYTACADSEDRFRQKVWKGETEYKEWFTPNTYTYPNMPWADPSVVKLGLTNPSAGTTSVTPVAGYNMVIRKPRGVTSGFLDYQLTDGEPESKEDDMWNLYSRTVVRTKWDKTHLIDGVEVNKFKPDLTLATDTADKELRQRAGELPYQNMNNIAYSAGGRPLIMSTPLFYGSEEASLSQSSNSARASASTTGVNLYRTREGYSDDADLLAEPELVTTSTWTEFGDSVYAGHVSIEPASGVALSGVIVNQVNTYTYNCNPSLDSTCGLFYSMYNASDPLCYGPSSGLHYPCSAYNIFTPKVMGEKVHPLYWLHVDTNIPDFVGRRFKSLLDTRYALSILVIVVPILCFSGISVIVWMVMSSTKRYAPTASDDCLPSNSHK